jgi:hypothetical protein
MINKQSDKHSASTRREDPRNVAFPHRLSFVYTFDEHLPLDAEHIRLVCEGERLSDFAGESGRRLGGQQARAAYKILLDDLRVAWDIVHSASLRLEHVGGPAVQHLIDQFTVLLERRYARFATVLPAGRPREEILANVARQLGELRVYFSDFNRNLADRAARLPYADQARFAGERYITLLAPSMRLLLGEDGGPVPGGFQIGEGGCGGSTPLPSPSARPARSALRPQSLAVSFEDRPPAAAPAPAPATPQPTPYSPWPYSSLFSPPPAGAGGSLYAASPLPPPPALPVAWPGYGGPLGGGPTIAAGAVRAPPASAAPSHVKQEPGSRSRKGDKEKFSAQPQHVWVAGSDCATVPEGEVWHPPCGCAGFGGPAYAPGPHATWDCPLRYISKFGHCPGYLPGGQRDPAQWLAGNVLTRAAKDAWIALIEKHHLPLQHDRDARAPPFQR